MAQTRSQKIRAERQEQLREYLSSRGLIDHVIDLADKIEEPDADIQALKASADIRLKLINKYLPEMKFVESDNTHDFLDQLKVVHEIVDANSTPKDT